MKLHDGIIQFLHAEDVETVFSMMAEDVMGMTAKLRESWTDEIDVVETRHEQWAVGMADGYARATNSIGVAVVGRGPAVAQTGAALGTARANGSPLLLITSEPPLSSTRDVKAFGQDAYLETMVGDLVTVRDEAVLVPKFADVFRRLRNGDGPIAVQIPWDVIDAEIEMGDEWRDTTIGDSRPAIDEVRLEPNEDVVEDAVDLYLDSDASRPPLILVGQGAVDADAKPAIERLADRTSALIATTLQAQGYFADHPFGVGFVGTFGTNLANEFASQSDFVLALGCSLNKHTTDQGRLLEEATVVHVDTDPSQVNAVTQADLGVIGDARATVEAMVDRLEADDVDFSGKFWTESLERKIAETSPFDEREYPEKQGLLDPREFVATLDPMLPEDRLVVTDGGHFINWVLDGVTIRHPDDYVWTIDFGSIGIGLPIGLGAAQGVDDRLTVIFCGDAGFMMSLQAVETAARYDVPALVVVMNDETLGSEYHQLQGRDEFAQAAIVETPDLAAVASDLGADGHSVRSVRDLEALEDLLSGRTESPVVLDCRIDREVRHRFYDTVHGV